MGRNQSDHNLGTDKWFHLTLHYDGCKYLSMLGLKLIHIGKRGPRGKDEFIPHTELGLLKYNFLHWLIFSVVFLFNIRKTTLPCRCQLELTLHVNISCIQNLHCLWPVSLYFPRHSNSMEIEFWSHLNSKWLRDCHNNFYMTEELCCCSMCKTLQWCDS